MLKFRPAGSKEWQHPCVLQPGLHLAAASSGDGAAGVAWEAPTAVHISKCCATTRILLLSGSPASTQAGTAVAATRATVPAGADAEPEPPLPLWVEAHCRQLQVCLWDDERQRLLPPAGPTGGTPPPLGRELFSLFLDHPALLLGRQQYLAAVPGAAPAGAASCSGSGGCLHPWQRQLLQVMSAQLTAATVQVDSFLPGSEQPVLLTSLPSEDVGATRRRRQGPPLQLALEVHHCLPHGSAAQPDGLPCAAQSSSGGVGMSLRNTWVHDLLIQLPTLAVAADDSLLLFADRVSGLFTPGGSIVTAAGGGSAGSVPAPAENGSDGSVTAAATSGSTGGAAARVAGSSGTAGNAAAGGAVQQQSQLELLQHALAAEAAGAAASRLYIEQAVVESGEQRSLWLPRRFACFGHLLSLTTRLGMAACAPFKRRLQCVASVLGLLPPLQPSSQFGCCWTPTSQRAQRACLWRWTRTAHPSR